LDVAFPQSRRIDPCQVRAQEIFFARAGMRGFRGFRFFDFRSQLPVAWGWLSNLAGSSQG
jgi:hypothetical protein